MQSNIWKLLSRESALVTSADLSLQKKLLHDLFQKIEFPEKFEQREKSEFFLSYGLFTTISEAAWPTTQIVLGLNSKCKMAHWAKFLRKQVRI